MLSLLLALAAPDIDSAIKTAIDPCPAAAPSSGITVCGRTRDEQNRRFRMPADPDRGFDPSGEMESVSRERHRLMDGAPGQDLTRGSCSIVGASGSTGCTIKKWRENDQQKGY